jgi:hypothetical protein
LKKRIALLVALLATLVAVLIYQITRPPVYDPVDLFKFEDKVFSQGGEDGVLDKIFEVIPPTRRFVVEFGCSDGVTYSNSRNLIVNHGWSGLLMDGDHAAIEKARKAYANYPSVNVAEEWIYPGNVETLFDKYGVPKDLDLLVIDIDSNDYYVWKVIHEYRPKVVLMEYNPGFPPPQKAVVQFHPLNYWDNSDYYGASLQSLYELNKHKGYEMVYGTFGGLNAFFVDATYYPRFGLRDNSPARFYRPPLYGVDRGGRAPNGRGHPPWDTWEEMRDGQLVKPYAGDLTWKEIRIPKRFVPLP